MDPNDRLRRPETDVLPRNQNQGEGWWWSVCVEGGGGTGVEVSDYALSTSKGDDDPNTSV